MGYYIDMTSKGVQLPATNKADYLILDGAVEIPEPKEFVDNLVCVMENGPFDAAGYAFNKAEFKAFTYPGDYRPKRWLIYEHAAKLSGYNR